MDDVCLLNDFLFTICSYVLFYTSAKSTFSNWLLNDLYDLNSPGQFYMILFHDCICYFFSIYKYLSGFTLYCIVLLLYIMSLL